MRQLGLRNEDNLASGMCNMRWHRRWMFGLGDSCVELLLSNQQVASSNLVTRCSLFEMPRR
jgi:hypothetical protein